MSRGKELIKNTGILMIAKISTQVVSFVLLPLYTAILSTEEYGRVDVYTSLSMIIIPFVTLQIEMALFRYFISARDTESQKKIISSSFFVVAVMLLITTVLYWSLNIFIQFPYSGFLYAYYFVMTINTVLLQVCRAKGDNVGYGLATFISSACAVGLNVVFIAGLKLGVEGILLSSILAHFLSSFFIVFRTGLTSYVSFSSISRKCYRELLNYSVPLIFNQIASWTVNYSDRLIILYFWGESFNGIYSVACKFSNILSTFFGVYNVAWTENVIRSMNDKDGRQYVSKVFNITFALYSMLVCGIINLLPFVFDYFVNEKFSASYGQVPILLIGMMFSGMAATVGSIYIAYNRTREVSITTMLTGVVNIIVHFALLKSCGLYAASISTLVAFALLFIYRLAVIRKFYVIDIDWKNVLSRSAILIFAWGAYISRLNWLILFGFVLNLVSIGILLWKNKQILLALTKRD